MPSWTKEGGKTIVHATNAAPERRCPHSSVEALNRHTRACGFAKADITALAKRMADRAAPRPDEADAADAAALKVEKNALALVFIPAVMNVAEQVLAAHPGVAFHVHDGRLGAVAFDRLRAALDRRNPQASACEHVYLSLQTLFQDLVGAYLASLGRAAEAGDEHSAWTVEHLLERYRRVLSGYHGHTAVARLHFTPEGHIMAGINTALFFILRALSAILVLGEARLGRPVGRDELAAMVRNSSPMLLAIARCHLEQLLELEGPLGKQADLFMSGLDAAATGERLAAMFELVDDAEGRRLEIDRGILAALPLLASEKPRTGCPALYASTADNVNAIVALVRLTERAFADLWFG